MRVILSTIFVVWPLLVVIKLLGWTRKPLCWLAGLISDRLAEELGSLIMKAGITLYFWSVWSAHGKEQAQLAVLMLLIDTLHSHE